MSSFPFSLALDLGATSIGWSVLNPTNHQVVDAGVRIFPAAMDETLFAKGEPGASRNLTRRTARLHRRQLRRRGARQRDLFDALQAAGLLPHSTAGLSPGARHETLAELDRQLSRQWSPRIRELAPLVLAPDQVLPYFLRAHALDHRLEPHELGRAFYHLGQRRGYKSNRKQGRKLEELETAEPGARKKKSAEPKDGDDRRVVEKAITELEARMKESSARTLGEYFSRLDPLSPSGPRIRAQWTARKMFEQEFETIWAAQGPHHPQILTPDLKQRLHQLLFFQRPISSGKPGLCELEPGCQRAAAWTLAAQRFRLLQKVNDLKLRPPNGNEQPLIAEQRQLLLDRLETHGDLTFPKIRELLALPKKTAFNLETGGEKRIPGNRTASVMRNAFDADNWAALPEAQRKHIVRVWAEAETGEELEETARQENWQLSAAALRDLAAHEPEDGYSRLSARALSKLLPRMERGEAFKTVERDIYGAAFSGREPKPLLPPVENVLPLIPNPAVMRALSELRKVVNAIVRKYGKPHTVRIELARDLKRTAKQRRSEWERMRDREQQRKRIVVRVQKEGGVPSPSGKDIEKGLLFEELQACAYCGKEASYAQLFTGQFESDHILPRNRFPDDSLGNKVLACTECNRLKLGRTPFEAFGNDAELWTQIQARIGKLDSQKRERILLPDSAQLEDFSNRHLADTRYISKLAARYLEELYGGRDLEVSDFDTRRAVYCSSGMVTATLRRAWGLDALLPRPPRPSDDTPRKKTAGKPRIDHRHHAVDAIVIALSSQAIVAGLSAASSAGADAYDRAQRRIAAPWPDFVESIRPFIENLNVSHRPEHKLNGALHDETNYGLRKNGEVHVRKPVQLLSAANIASDDCIVDRKVRDAVRARLAEVGDPKKLENNWPLLVTKTGKHVPIRRVRVRVPGRPQRIALPPRERHVMLNANHHIAIFETRDKKGRPKWDTPGVLSLYEAMQRKKKGEPVIERTLAGAADAEFQFSLMGNDMVEMDDPGLGRRNLFVVRKISEYGSGRVEVAFVRHNDARIITSMSKTDYDRVTRLNELRERGCRKVTLDPLGRVHYAHD